MLDVTTNSNINCAGGMTSGSLDDDMDPLFDNDWLHEHNLDILFDLFEEEMERKGLDAANTNSTNIFGTPPVTSYLFGTSPTVAALDIYDLLYFENQQQQQQQTISSNGSLTTNSNNSTTNNQANNNSTTATYNISNTTATDSRNNHPHSRPQTSQNVSTNHHIANSITNAMKIKRKSKKGQSEGVSLLARPLSSNTSSSCGINNNNNNNLNNGSSNLNNKNNSDKTSTKITNLKKTIINRGSSCGGIDINQSKQIHHNRNKHLHHYHHQYVTGCAVIREHAYAVRGH